MNSSTCIKKIAWLVGLTFLYQGNASSQSFTKVTSALNPVVTDSALSGGGSWIDINNDGLLDLFVSNGNLDSQNNFLYLNTGGGSFKKVITGVIVNDGGSSIGSTWGDYDNDGFLDCFVTNRNFYGNFLYHGNGDTVFTKVTSGEIVTDMKNSNSSSWVDLNNDGRVDLYDVVFSQDDLMYISDGTSFTKDPTNPAVTDGASYSIPGAWADYNNDGYPDLLRGNSGTENDDLLTNNGDLTFSITTLNDGRSTTGGSWADFDNDGDLDFFSADYLNSGNVLYINSGAPNYNLTLVTTGTLAEAGNCVGSAWGDIDNDGDLDLFVSNDGANNLLYLNNGAPDYSFTKVLTGIVVNDPGNSFGGAFADYDDDGQLDLFVANHQDHRNFLYHNDGNTNHWITVKCVGTLSNKAAIGARVYVKANINGTATWQMQEVRGQTGYNSQNLWLHFGLAAATIIDSVIIKYPSGIADACANISVDAFYTATEGSCLSITSINNLSNSDHVFNLSITPNPFSDQTKISYSLPKLEWTTIIVFDETGKEVRTLINSEQSEGSHDLSFNSDLLTPGIYICKMSSGNFSSYKKMVVVKR